MSYARFAPITASLLARKGGAMPSSMMPPAIMPPFVPAVERAAPRPAAQAEPEHDHDASHDPTRPKKLFIALSHREHERLSIAAVKTGLSRHQLVRDALDAYFEQLSRDMHQECACMSGAKTCSGSCDA